MGVATTGAASGFPPGCHSGPGCLRVTNSHDEPFDTLAVELTGISGNRRARPGVSKPAEKPQGSPTGCPSCLGRLWVTNSLIDPPI